MHALTIKVKLKCSSEISVELPSEVSLSLSLSFDELVLSFVFSKLEECRRPGVRKFAVNEKVSRLWECQASISEMPISLS